MKEYPELNSDEYKDLKAEEIYAKHNHPGVPLADQCKCTACEEVKKKSPVGLKSRSAEKGV